MRVCYLEVARAYERAALHFTILAAPACPDRELLLDVAARYRAIGRELRRVHRDASNVERHDGTAERVAA